MEKHTKETGMRKNLKEKKKVKMHGINGIKASQEQHLSEKSSNVLCNDSSLIFQHKF